LINTNYIEYINNISKKTSFLPQTLEKVDRLLKILEWINSDGELSEKLALKGGTAINIAIFDFPRLSVDIDLDLTCEMSRDEMLIIRERIKTKLYKFLLSNRICNK
jgi:predicted nucleotidyltransferase component of viral defense system